MTHNLKISVSKKPAEGGVVRCKRVTMRERLLHYLFGEKRRVMVIVPGDSVECVSITELPYSGIYDSISAIISVAQTPTEYIFTNTAKMFWYISHRLIDAMLILMGKKLFNGCFDFRNFCIKSEV